MKFKEGISAIVPTYKGENHIEKLLNSIKKQTIDFSLFEIIFIVNGESDRTPEIINKFKEENPKINIVLEYSEKGASNARNVGIEKASREYSVFIDDDDFISEKYFETVLKYVKEDRIVIGTFLDVNEETGDIQESYLTPPLLKRSGIVENPYTDEYQGILTITLDKIIPTKYVKEVRFNPELKNGEDIGYFSILYAKYDFEFYVVDKEEDAVYYRLWRDQSISRQSLTYEFNVTDRLKVINEINKSIKLTKNVERVNYIKSFTGGQVVMINQYLNQNPQDLKKVCHDISSYDFEFFPYKYFNEYEELNKPNNELIISYTFPPTNTTTGNTQAKRILTKKQNVDVIYATTNSLNKDYDFYKLVEEFIIEKFEIDLDFSTSWENMKEFSEKGMNKLHKKYDTIYSRAFFPHSHFLALEYKLKHPDTYWKAEFSDPLIYNHNKQELSSPINDEEYVNRINKCLPKKYTPLKVDDSVHFICEYLTYIFADELIFTNENQIKVMKDLFPYEIELKNKITINPHPTLDEKYYYIKENDYELDDNYINFAYFGVLNANRTLEDFIEGFDLLEEDFKDKFRLHIFTNTQLFTEQIFSRKLFEKTIINPTISYLEFLNLSTKFDVLLVDDSQNSGIYIKNPFLPSKISDYLGAETDIWAVCDEDSPMSKLNIKYKSNLNDLHSVKETINQIMIDKLNLKMENKYKIPQEDLESILKEKKEDNIYLKHRLTELSTRIDELLQVYHSLGTENNVLKAEIAQLKAENDSMKNFNSWKYTEKLRKIGRKFK